MAGDYEKTYEILREKVIFLFRKDVLFVFLARNVWVRYSGGEIRKG